MQTKSIEKSINEQAGAIKASLDSANKEFQSAYQEILHLKNEQVKIYQEIATIFLLESPKNDDVHIQALIKKLQELFDALKKRSYELDQLTLDYQQKVSDTLSRIDELTTQKIIQLESDPDYVSLFNLFKESEDSLNKETKSFRDAQEEFSKKLAPYHQNRCYNYLIKRNFGENNYRGFWIFRNLDAWVARFINFAGNYKNQKILEALLKESQLRYDTKKSFYHLILEQKEQKEQQVDDSLKLPQLRDELAQTERVLANYSEQKENTYKDLNDTRLGQSNQFYEIANQLAQFLQQQSHNTLEHLTLQTKSIDDDVLLQKIPALAKQIQQLEARLPELQQTIGTLEQTYNRFNQTLFIFKQNNIPSSFYKYNFSSSSLNELLNNLLNKNVFPETIVQALIANRVQINTTNSSTKSSGWSILGGGSSSSSSRSRSYSSSSSSSNRSSGFSSSSSTGGGGFRTTDSF